MPDESGPNPEESDLSSSHPTATEDSNQNSRGQARIKRAGLVTLTSLLMRLTTAASLIISVPLTVHYLGTERYGAWMTVSSFVAMMAFADLGMGIGLLNQVADADGAHDRERMRVAISSAFSLLTAICITLLIVLSVLLAMHVTVPIVKTTNGDIRREASLAIYACFACIFINLPFDVVQRIQLGLQKGNVTYLWQWAGSLGALLALCLAVYFRAPLHILVLAVVGTPLIATALNAITFFAKESDLRPSRAYVKAAMIKKLLGEGVLFCLLQVLASTSNNMDNVILGNVVGAVEVAIYSTAVRLFNIVQTLITLFINALWPAFRESHSRGDFGWLKKTYDRAIKIALLVSLAITPFLALASPWIIRTWTRGAIHVPISVLAARAVWLVIDSFVGPSGVLLSSLSKILIQIGLMGSYVAVGFALKPYLAKNFGMPYVAWSSSAMYAIIVAVPMWIYIKKSPIWKLAAKPASA